MEYIPERNIKSEDYIITSTGNIISRRATIGNARSLEIPSGKCFIDEGCSLASDIAPIQLNRHCFISSNVTLQPCRTFKEPIESIKMTIGTNTFIGEGSHVQAARIGAGCVIGRNVVIGPRCILKDYVRVEDGANILADTVFPPFAIIAGNPAQMVGELPESTSTLVPIISTDRYKSVKVVKV